MKIPRNPKNPDRICWGCDKLCPASDLRCGNGSVRAPHPSELFGEDWWKWENAEAESDPEPDRAPAEPHPVG